MNKLFTKIAALALGATMAVGVGVAVASSTKEATPVHAAGTDATWNLTANNVWTSASTTAVVYSNSYVTIQVNKGTGTNANNYLGGQSGHAHTRWYSGNTMDVTPAEGYKINSMTITATSNSYQYWSAGTNCTVSGTTTKTVTPTTKTSAFSLTSGGTGRYTQFVVNYEQATTTESLTAITGISATITATVGDDDWTISDLSVTGTLSVSGSGQNVTDLVDVTTNTSVPDEPSNSYAVSITASKKSTTTGTASDYTTSINAVVSADPYADLVLIDDVNDVSTSAIYALSHEKKFFAGNDVVSSGLPSTSSFDSTGFFQLESTTDGYYLKFVVQNAQTGAWEDKSSSKYINNSSKTGLSASGTASSVWTVNEDDVDSVVQGVILQNSSNDNRFIGWNGTSGSSTASAKAYSTSNLHQGDNNAPLYLYEVPQDTLQSLTISGTIPTYTAGSQFSFGRTATAHYSSSGDVVVNSGLSFTLGGTAIAAGDTIPVNKVGTQAVVVTYTDSSSASVSATAYNVTVNYKGATEIELNVSEAGLSIGGTVSLTATVGDEYANPNAVSWSSGNSSIATVSAASGTKTITVTGVAAGNTTITATANGHSATCAISVTADPILNLLDEDENIINDSTLNHFTGDASVYIQADSENVVSPTYLWDNEDDSVVTIDASSYLCEVTIVGAGNSEVSVTVGALTRTVTFSVTASGVTALSLTSSVEGGEIYDGTYLNTLTLTPNITKQGNATNVINWSSNETGVATVSSASTSGTAITVTGVSAGTAVITARSAYTPSTYVEYTVTVSADGVTNFSWTNKPYFDSDSSKSHIQIYTNETTLAQIAAAGNSSYGTFAPTWASGKSDSPSFGTGANDVHFVLSPTVVNSEQGLTPLTASSTFTKNDNGKYVLAFYKGVRAQGTMPTLTVINWRSVIESSTTTTTGTFDFSGSSAKGTGFTISTLGQRYSDAGGLAAPSISGITALYDGNGSGGAIQGSGFARIGKNGSFTLTFANGTNISSVTMGLRSWSSTEDCVISVTNCDSFTTSNGDYEQHTFTLTESTNVITISSNNARAFIDAITITATAGGEQEIGKTTDCLGLEVYIDTYLHMDDYTSSQGWCKDEEHNYYGKNTETGAKYHFNQLNDHQRSLLSSNSAYTAEWARLSAWAAANGESLNASNQLAAVHVTPLVNIVGDTNTVAIIVIISVISVSAIGGYFFLRKRREQN